MYSEQYLVSCDSSEQGCSGGYLNKVWQFLEKTGAPTDTCVPYTSGSAGVTGTCPTKCKSGSAIVLTKAASGFKNVCSSESSIVNAIVQGPLTTRLTVYEDFYSYKSGIYHHVSGANLGGHAVEFVGYGTENGVKYWKVKNSWGSSWAERGFFRIVKGSNECGIETECYLGKV